MLSPAAAKVRSCAPATFEVNVRSDPTPVRRDGNRSGRQVNLVRSGSITEGNIASRRKGQAIKVGNRVDKRRCRVTCSNGHIAAERDRTGTVGRSDTTGSRQRQIKLRRTGTVDRDRSTRTVTNRRNRTDSTLEVSCTNNIQRQV